jgi:hypothetical protein
MLSIPIEQKNMKNIERSSKFSLNLENSKQCMKAKKTYLICSTRVLQRSKTSILFLRSMTCKSAAGRIGLVQMTAYRGAVRTEQQLSDRGILTGLCHRNIKKKIFRDTIV